MAHSTDYAARVAEVVKAELKARKTSPSALSALTGMSRMTIERRLSGGLPGFTVTELAAVAPHIGMTPGEIATAAERDAA